jgi:hypothetical protein
MAWLDRLMDKLTTRGPKIAGTGHGPGDYQPPTGALELSEELEADYGPDTPAAEPPVSDSGDAGSTAD